MFFYDARVVSADQPRPACTPAGFLLDRKKKEKNTQHSRNQSSQYASESGQVQEVGELWRSLVLFFRGNENEDEEKKGEESGSKLTGGALRLIAKVK